MKKILLSVLIISLVGAVAIGATGAYFSDTETSTGNTFTAGTIDLALNDANPYPGTALVTLSDIKPSQNLDSITLKLTNVGQNDGNLTINFSYTEKDKWTGTEPVKADFEFTSNGDATMEMTDAEFASLMYVQAITEDGQNILPALVALGYDTNGDGKVSLYELSTKGSFQWSAATAPYDTYLAAAGTVDHHTTTTLVVTLHLGDSLDPFSAGGKILTGTEDNRPQADGIELSVTATLKQVV